MSKLFILITSLLNLIVLHSYAEIIPTKLEKRGPLFHISNKHITESFDEIYLPLQIIHDINLNFSIKEFYNLFPNGRDSILFYEYPDNLNILVKKNTQWKLLNIKSGLLGITILTDTVIPISNNRYENEIKSTYPEFIIRNQGHYSVLSNDGSIVFNDSIFNLNKQQNDKIVIELILNCYIGNHIILCKNCSLDYIKLVTKSGNFDFIHRQENQIYIDTVAIGYQEGLAMGGGLYNVFDLKNKKMLFEDWSEYIRIDFYETGNPKPIKRTELNKEFKLFEFNNMNDIDRLEFHNK